MRFAYSVIFFLFSSVSLATKQSVLGVFRTRKNLFFSFIYIINSIISGQAINEKILSLDYGKLSADITSVDAQDSYNGGVFVLVTGHLIGIDNLRRKFTQSFFLAPQDPGYFVLNDVFRYVDDAGQQNGNQALVDGVEGPLTPEQGNVKRQFLFEL